MSEGRQTTERRTSSSMVILEEGPESARLLRFRLIGTGVVFVLAALWCVFEGGYAVTAMLTAAASAGITLLTILWARRSFRLWMREIHVAADVLLIPTLIWATGGYASPFVTLLVLKWLTSALIVGQRRAVMYSTSTTFAALSVWLWPLLGAPGFAQAATAPVLVAMITVALGVGMLQAASMPIEAYRDRRRALLQENRRMEEAIAELETQNRGLSALHGLARDIGTLGGVEEVAISLRDALLRTFPGQGVSFFLYRREHGWLEPILLPSRADKSRASRLGMPDGALMKAFLETASPVEGSEANLLDPSNVGQVLVPLHLGEKSIGLMVLEGQVKNLVLEDESQLLATMGNEMAVALRNAELHARNVELRESLESLVQNANALILVVDAPGMVEVANRALIELVEPALDPVGHPAADLFVPESAAELARSIEVVRGGAPVENLTLRLKRNDLRAVFNLAPVSDRNGKFRAVIAVGQDITRMEMLERGIVQSERLASLGQFVAGIAHEMNNPLTAITAYGDFLRGAYRQGGLPDDADEKLDQIVYAGERIQGFVQSLLGLARPESGERKLVDLNRVVEEAVRLCQYDLSKTNLEVKTTLASHLPPIDGTPAELQQVFINLLVNASHAMPESGGELRISTGAVENAARVSVSDTGSGMPASVASRIFEPFYTTKGEGQGTGLGLSIVKKIVEQHGGHISVESTEGKGTTFIMEFPRSTAATAGTIAQG